MKNDKPNDNISQRLYDTEWSDEFANDLPALKVQQAIRNMYSQSGSWSERETEEEASQ